MLSGRTTATLSSKCLCPEFHCSGSLLAIGFFRSVAIAGAPETAPEKGLCGPEKHFRWQVTSGFKLKRSLPEEEGTRRAIDSLFLQAPSLSPHPTAGLPGLCSGLKPEKKSLDLFSLQQIRT